MEPHTLQIGPSLPGERVLQHDRRFDLEVLLDQSRILTRFRLAELAQRGDGLVVSLLHEKPAR